MLRLAANYIHLYI